ncbi:unnamed protein product [Allacma fusca]|uniref:Uncharacterized protein n=1 Tax=Allacma fusca TaxID=39272 RepID=A0A8J2KUY2_9HEXA|nr:unnamed protein product [Allacma fusca]
MSRVTIEAEMKTGTPSYSYSSIPLEARKRKVYTCQAPIRKKKLKIAWLSLSTMSYEAEVAEKFYVEMDRHINSWEELTQLLLFPEESWARSATTAYWLLSVSWWSRSRCRITEVSGSQKRSARAKIHEIEDSTLCIIGSFKTGAEPDFKLVLTSDVAQEDFNMGYSLTGLLERGDRRKYGLQPSHFVAVRRKELEPESTRLYHVYSNFTASSLYDIYDYQ